MRQSKAQGLASLGSKNMSRHGRGKQWIEYQPAAEVDKLEDSSGLSIPFRIIQTSIRLWDSNITTFQSDQGDTWTHINNIVTAWDHLKKNEMPTMLNLQIFRNGESNLFDNH
jgi:hypothetical protein